jgi:L-aminopeptidase/D-esterase-like protein
VDPPAVSFADHRGGWPGSYDTAASDLGKTFLERHAFFLTGGDIYGYDAAIGIRRFLLERGLAEPSGGGRMPAIMGTNIYDLDYAHVETVDFVDLGNRACAAATSKPVAPGSVGAGTGATVGPFLEDDPTLVGTKGGLGSSAARAGPWTVGAIAVANCVGNVFDADAGRTIAGAHRRGSRRFIEMDDLLDAYLRGSRARSGTTIAVLGTNAPVDHEQLARIVELAHDGIALAVRPAHMATDGDTILGFTTGRGRRDRLDWRAVDVLAHVAVREIARSIVRGVRAATSSGGPRGLADPGRR